MQRNEDDSPLLPPIQRRETTPARMMGPRQLTNQFWQRDAAPVQESYPTHYFGEPPQGSIYYQPYPMHYRPPLMYYQPYNPPYSQLHPMQLIRVRPQPGMPEPIPPPGLPLSSHRDYDDDDYDDESIDIPVRRVMGRDMNRHDTGGLDGIGSSTVYSFTPSRMSHAASTQPSMYIDDELPGRDEDDAGGAARKEPDRALRLLHVFQSQYKGDHTPGGSHGVKLTAVLSSRLKYQALFRWLYVDVPEEGDFASSSVTLR
ncbi:hypothetical protein MMYC01_204553 [Madurella mycetomatis]|uniref:Uncharacterized protein n=1 Tax=Madurella mycetomatis TaxID=100816 RepID=A0A175W6W5_9PEZI|nr:hypothetical protein MMYC01_204553 [Madurella mycetomatis]